MKKIHYRFAQSEDIPAVQQLLMENQLPHEDIIPHIAHFIVATTEGNSMIGSVGLEMLAPYALLRSLAVDLRYRNQGIASQLLEEVYLLAKTQQIAQLFLLTTTAGTYFEKSGFQKIERTTVPEPLLTTREFSELCPSSSVCFTTKLDQKK